MGSLFHTPKPPAPVIPIAPPAAAPPTLASSTVQANASNSRQRAAAGGAGGGTNPTGSQGLKEPPTLANATLLGGTK